LNRGGSTPRRSGSTALLGQFAEALDAVLAAAGSSGRGERRQQWLLTVFNGCSD